MGKHKDKSKDHEHDSSSKKKSKKHKHKHKKKHSRSTLSDDAEEIDVDVVNNDEMSCSSQDEGKIKLKIKFGGRTLSTTEVASDNTNEHDRTFDDNHREEEVLTEKEARRKARSEKLEEDRWLEALEKGELDDNGGLKKEKDKSLMTARQKALHGDTKDTENYLMQLPMYPERTEEENEEFERKRKLRAKKRKQQMQQQIEDTKTQTVEKLLTKTQKASKKEKEVKQTVTNEKLPHVRYSDRIDGQITLSFVNEMDFPMVARKAKEPPKVILCSVSGCCNPKKYSCSNTNSPVCSLQCYKLVNVIKNEEMVS